MGYAYTLHPGASVQEEQGYTIEQTGTPLSIEAGIGIHASSITYITDTGDFSGKAYDFSAAF